MQILIIAATKMELGALPDLLKPYSSVSFFTTGAGTPSTLLNLTKHLACNRYDFAINIGIGGSYSKELETGEVVEIIRESFADLGIEDENGFSGLENFPFCPKEISVLHNSVFESRTDLKKMTGFTFDTVHGRQERIDSLDISEGIETMEGAAVRLCCTDFGLELLQLRGVSNYVESRDVDTWGIDKAIHALEFFVFDYVSRLV